MKTTMQPRRRHIHALGRLMGIVLAVWTLGAVYSPAVAATNVTVDQQPLTLQPVIPPNVTLMLDDSGSMNWDFMPDAQYLPGQFSAMDETQQYDCQQYGYNCNSNDVFVPVDTLRNSTANGVYYDPTITYQVPVQANGTSWQTPTGLGAAFSYPFTSTPTTIDVTQHVSPWLCDYNNYSTTQSGSNACPNSLFYAYPYYTAFPTSGNTTGPVPTCIGSDSKDSTTGMCSGSSGEYVPVMGCNPNGTQTGKYNPATGYCEYGNVAYVYLFTYGTAGNTAGSQVRNYVGKSTDCTTAKTSSAWPSGATCVQESDTSGLAAPKTVTAGQNIAIWFSYYRKRILMAKSGLMEAFSTVDPKFRIGFGSINNHGSTTIQALGSGNYNTYNGRYIAYVQPFGSGASGTQKSNFWNWVSGLSAGNSTPLRKALDAVGQYYSGTDSGTPSGNAWDTMSSDPGYVAGGSNSPIACRQSYTILTTDGFWNSNYSSSLTLHASDKAGPTMTGPNGTAFQYSPAAPYSGGDAVDGSGNATPSLADVAMYYWENDLQTGLSDEVPANKQDPAFWQHMTTFTMGLGFQPSGISGTAPNNDSPPTTADIANWSNDGGAATSQYAISNFSWPQPSSANGGSINNIADLEHAGVNGHGGFYSATNPATFTSGLQDALKRALTRSGTGASLAANSTQLNNGTVAYQAKYLTAVWSGDLLALPINSSTGAIASPTNASWSAVTKFPGAASRTIVTYNPSGTGAAMWPAFQDDATTGAPPTLSTAEQAALGSTATAQAAMVNYLRGDKSGEGTTYRYRTTPLGDIVDSQPVYSGAPNSNEFVGETFTGINNPTSSTSCDASFAGFAGGDAGAAAGSAAAACYDATSRTPLVFVAANDGMLHAFNGSTGTEVYAYLPGAVITGDVAVNSAATTPTFDNTALATLANPNYGSTTGSTPHQFYNDGELTVADVYFGSAWHTVLVGTTGRGPAEAVYALDITKATVSSTGAISGITPLWERSAHDGLANSTYIGEMVGKPVIAKVQDGTANADWQVLIGNGYNSASGQAALLEFNVYDGTLTVHTTTSIDSTKGNGLAAPVAWMNDPSSGISTQAYAGDLQGQVWNFPLSVATTTKSGSTITTTYTPDPNPLGGKSSTATVIFTTPSQPITAGMLAGRDPKTGNVWLFFGTGQYLSSADLSNRQVESWYGVIAQSSSGTVTSGATQSSLVQRAITYEQDGNPSASPPTLGLRTVTPTPTTSDMSGKLGWFMNLEAPTGTGGALVAQGERMVTPNQFQANLLLGTTRIPVVTDICNPSGSGWVMAVNPFTGTNPSAAFFLANGGSGMVSIKNPDGSTSSVPAAGVGFSSLPNNPIFVGGDMLMSFDNGTTSSLMTTGSTGALTRVSWQELVNP